MTTWTQFCSFLTTTYLFNPERGQNCHSFGPLIVHDVVIERPQIGDIQGLRGQEKVVGGLKDLYFCPRSGLKR